jgi:hypothetical protein
MFRHIKTSDATTSGLGHRSERQKPAENQPPVLWLWLAAMLLWLPNKRLRALRTPKHIGIHSN